MAPAVRNAFRLTVLNPRGRDVEQEFPDGAGEVGAGHQPTNFHAYAACTGGSFQRDTRNAIAKATPVLLLLRGDFVASEAAFSALKAAGKLVAVSLKETGLHQIAEQLEDARKMARWQRLLRAADGCIASTPEAADVYRAVRGADDRVAYIPTPYPIADARWNFSRPQKSRRGIFIGTREWDVHSRNHAATIFLARQISAETGEPITVYNFDGRKAARLISGVGIPAEKLRVLDGEVPYAEYLRELATHRIVLQLDTSFVPGQVAGDALLCRVPCVGGNGAIERIAFPNFCGGTRSIEEIRQLALRLLNDREFYRATIEQAEAAAKRDLSFEVVAPQLEDFFASIASK